MTRSLLLRHAALFALALLQACAGQAPLLSDSGDETPAAVPLTPPAAEAPAEPPPPALPPLPEPKAASATPVLPDAARLPPFEGDRVVVEEPLRGVMKIDRTAPHADLWQRIRAGFAMPNLENSLVRRATRQYASSPEYLQRMFDRSRLYLYHIVDEIEKRGLPTELALLPMVESAFNPMAYSRAHASGLWQFIPGTGKRYDLAQNWWYDARRDIVASTSAALDYLTHIYEMHGDWHLALASYNWGENAVKRAIAKNRAARKPTDYSSLKMPRETRFYVPKLQALKNIIANPEPFGIDLDPIPNEPYFAIIEKKRDIDVELAAKLAEMPVGQFRALNPGFSRPLIRSSVASRIVLPADKVEVFQANLAKMDEEDLVSWQVYHPKRGERLGTIAKKFRLSIADLKRVNGIRPRSWVVPRRLLVPIAAGKPGTPAPARPMVAAPAPVRPAARNVHVVRRGETLYSIAAKYKVTVADLKRWNQIGTILQIGEKIDIGKRR